MYFDELITQWENGNASRVWDVYNEVLSIGRKEAFLDYVSDSYIPNFSDDDRIQLLKYFLKRAN